MAIYINNPQTEEAIRALAAQTGLTMTDAVASAVDMRLKDIRAQTQPNPRDGLAEKLHAIARSCKLIPGTEHLSADDIIGYNEYGVWD